MADENEFAAFAAVADAVANHSFAEQRREFRRKIADLIRMREQDEIGLRGFDDLLERDAISVWSVVGEQFIFDGENFRDGFSCEFARKCANAFAKNNRTDSAGSSARNLLRGGERFETGVIPLALTMFGDDEDFHG